MTKERNLSKVLTYAILIFFAFIWILPLAIAVIKSFTINGLGNYAYVLSYEKISYFRVIFNSMFISVLTAIAVTVITSLAGYAFSKMHFIGSKLIYGAILACLAVPVAAVTSPLFATIKNLHLLDTHWGVILPLIAFNAPMMLLMIKNYFDSIPSELLESARMDGAGTLRIWYQFMIGSIISRVLPFPTISPIPAILMASFSSSLSTM